MTVQQRSETSIRLEPDRLVINGKSEILLCASLFYFRLPRADWRERMAQLKAYGYNAIDVYFPWNCHEREEGVWDFDGERDADEFLRLAAEAGLWVIARPGPYICSEWDGGALPAYLLAKENVTLRDHNPAYLNYAAKWYAKILPILGRHELANGGTVIAVQLENELDFYNCGDPRGYVSALRDMALAQGITVPLIACAGQGGLFGASGDAEGVVPTCNFYPDNRSPTFETVALAYKRELAQRGVPLLVTETNRSHFLLRRLLSCGVKLLGPYLQASGADFGFTNAINNWGRPLAFMTSDYDFAGMISPEGHVRAEAFEGRLLRRIVDVYGAALAEATPLEASNADEADGCAVDEEVRVWRDRGYDVGPFRLALQGGGRIAFVSDTSRETCLMLPEAVSLGRWGINGGIDCATAELIEAKADNDGCSLVFLIDDDRHGRVELSFDEAPHAIASQGAAVSVDGQAAAIGFNASAQGLCTFRWDGGRRLTVFGVRRSEALVLEAVDGANGELRFGAMPANEQRESPLELDCFAAEMEAHTIDPNAIPAPTEGDSLEARGAYRGYAWYEYECGQEDGSEGTSSGGNADSAPRGERRPAVLGLLAAKASDIVSLYADGDYLGTFVPGGASRYAPLAEAPARQTERPNGRQRKRLTARVEIWGHSNFDDRRLPALRLNATKGVADLTAVTQDRDLTGYWRFRRRSSDAHPGAATHDPLDTAADTPDDRWPLTGFGGWHPNELVASEIYRRTLELTPGCDSRTLWFDGLGSSVRVFADGRELAVVTPDDPWLRLPADLAPASGGRLQLTLALERRIGAAAGRVRLLEGRSARLIAVARAEERQLAASADLARLTAEPAALPYALAEGQVAWLHADLPGEAVPPRGWRVRAEGANVKLTVFAGDRLLARLWLPGGDERPTMTGGSPDSFYLPGAWLRTADERRLRLMIEAVVRGEAGRLDALRFIPV